MHNPAFRPDSLRARFVTDDLSTASPARVVVLCFDRLDRDLHHALEAMDTGDHFVVNDALGHAQDLIAELVNMLDVDAWEHAGALMSIYDYLLRLLAVANARKAPSLVSEARRLVGELGDGFRSAAGATTAAETGSASPTASQASSGWTDDGRPSAPGISVRA